MATQKIKLKGRVYIHQQGWAVAVAATVWKKLWKDSTHQSDTSFKTLEAIALLYQEIQQPESWLNKCL